MRGGFCVSDGEMGAEICMEGREQWESGGGRRPNLKLTQLRQRFLLTLRRSMGLKLFAFNTLWLNVYLNLLAL